MSPKRVKERKVTFSFTADVEYGYMLRFLMKKQKLTKSQILRRAIREYVKMCISPGDLEKYKYMPRWYQEVLERS